MAGAWWLSKEGTCMETTWMMIMAQKMPMKAQKVGMRLPVLTGLARRWPKKWATG